MKPKAHLQAAWAGFGVAAVVIMGVSVVVGPATGGPEVATVTAPETAQMTLGETVTTQTNTPGTTTSILSFRPAITAAQPPPPTH